jgi:hypothetical protein
MNSYDIQGIAAEHRIHQLLQEAEQRRLVRAIQQRHDHATDQVALRTRLAVIVQRLGRRGRPAAVRTIVVGR